MTDRADHELARRLASETADLLVGLLHHPPLSTGGLEALGDELAHEHLVARLAEERPGDAVLSEEGVDDPSRLRAERVWIIDPLDGSSDFGWSGQWSVHVALCVRGRVAAGAVAVPALGEVFATDPPPRPVMSRFGPRPVGLVSRSRSHLDGRILARALGAEVAAVGSAGVKAMAVVRGEADVYLHGGGLYEWDSCAPVAVARAAGLHASRLDGSEPLFNQPDPWMPGLLICRPELAGAVLEAVAGG